MAQFKEESAFQINASLNDSRSSSLCSTVNFEDNMKPAGIIMGQEELIEVKPVVCAPEDVDGADGLAFDDHDKDAGG